MTGGLINIVSYGFDDLYLTGAPQITFFKVVYRRHTNFSKESVSLPLGELNFNNEINIPVPKIGDLTRGAFLQLDIPSVKFLKTETAADLTKSEKTVLETAFDIPLTSDQLAIASDYQTVLDFMAINTNGYRIAVDNKDIKNQTTETYVNSILAVLLYSGLDTEYEAALLRALTYENSINNRKTYFLSFGMSNIKETLNTTIVEDSKYDDYTIQDVFNMVSIAINVSKEVTNYYFKKVQEKRDLEIQYGSRYAKFAWVEKLGHAIIDRIDINIGGERIDRHYGDWINIWYELTSSSFQDNAYNRLIGNVREMTTFDNNEKPKYILTIPISFWFCKNPGLAFPLIALQYSTFSLTIKLKKIESCAYIEKLPTKDQDGNDIDILALSLSDIWENVGLNINATLLIDYIYLDSLERKRFAQSAHEYLVETVQYMSLENVTDQRQSITFDFSGPCKEIIWIAQKMSYVEEESTNNKLLFNYSYSVNKIGNPILSSKLTLNGYTRFESTHNNYFNYLQPNSHHMRTPSDGINVYSFSLYTEEHQPSSCCNFSRIGNSNFVITINPKMFVYKKSDVDPSITPDSEDDEVLSTAINIRIYATRYNILRIIGGMAGFAYQYSV